MLFISLMPLFRLGLRNLKKKKTDVLTMISTAMEAMKHPGQPVYSWTFILIRYSSKARSFLSELRNVYSFNSPVCAQMTPKSNTERSQSVSTVSAG